MPSDGIRVPLERAKRGGTGAEGRKRPSVLFLSVLHAWPPSFKSICHALPPSLLLHTHPKNTQVHMSKQGTKTVCLLLSWGPGPVSASRLNSSGIEGGDQCCQTSNGCSRLNSHSQQCEKGPQRFETTSMPMKLFINKHNGTLITSAIFTTKEFLTPQILELSQNWVRDQYLCNTVRLATNC